MKKGIGIFLILNMCVCLLTSCDKEKRVVYQFNQTMYFSWNGNPNLVSTIVKNTDTIVRGKVEKISGYYFKDNDVSCQSNVSFRCTEVIKGNIKRNEEINFQTLSRYYPCKKFMKYSKYVEEPSWYQNMSWFERTFGYIEYSLNNYGYLQEGSEYIMFLNKTDDGYSFPFYGSFEVYDNKVRHQFNHRQDSLEVLYKEIQTTFKEMQ
ncbi:hypothetical protein RBG61_12585 [Paludicola sp. MB14-C6]|uniref:hypothetical protein n=1 Tax=Paludihabitans sp. MB14-C6 TaxID=3070656 RepID=UPI0027DBF8A7|nr:hypothetical protein [Paludicola sp. MB14-C6]WMJ22818.1 hypothetical protein RBG61_12585 [Paludicola sp. MB14-C6]